MTVKTSKKREKIDRIQNCELKKISFSFKFSFIGFILMKSKKFGSNDNDQS